MSEIKVFNWEHRVPYMVPKIAKKIYFFRKSFEACDDKDLKGLLIGDIESDEKNLGITHTEKVSELIGNISKEAIDDPLLASVFGKKPFDRKSILDYYEKDADSNNAVSFVDLCVLLGDLQRARKFSERTGREYELLKIIEKTDGKTPSVILRQEVIRMWLESAAKNTEAARLTSVIYRSMVSEGEELLAPLAELWGEGYYWDAFCLIPMLLPNNAVFPFMKKNMPQLLKTEGSSLLAKILREFGDASNEKGLKYEDQYIKSVDAWSLYRIVKVDISRNENMNTNEMERLVIRAKCAEAFRHVLLDCWIQNGPLDAKIMASDALHFVNTFGSASDFFPHAEKFLFEKCIDMISDMFSAVQHILRPGGPSTLNFANDKDTGIANIIIAHWRKQEPDMWSTAGYWARSSCVQTCHNLKGHLAVLENYFGPQIFKFIALKLALRLCWLFCSEDFDASKEVHRSIISLAVESGFHGEATKVLADRFTNKLLGKKLICDSVAEHLTGEQFISNIRKLSTTSALSTEQVTLPTKHVQTGTIPCAHPTQPSQVGSVPYEQTKESDHINNSKENVSASAEQSQSHEVHLAVTSEQVDSFSAGQQQNMEPVVSVISDDGMHVEDVVDENCMVTKWEASSIKQSGNSQVEQTVSVDSLPPNAKENTTAQNTAVKEESFINKSADWSATKQEIEMPAESSVKQAMDSTNVQTVPIPPKSVPVERSVERIPKDSESTYSDDGWGDPPAAVTESSTSDAPVRIQEAPKQEQNPITPKAADVRAPAAVENTLDSLLGNSNPIGAGGDAGSIIDARQEPTIKEPPTVSPDGPIATKPPVSETPLPPVAAQPAPIPPVVAAPVKPATPVKTFATGGFENMPSCSFGAFGQDLSGNQGGGGFGQGGGQNNGYGQSRGGGNFGGGRGGNYGAPRGGFRGGGQGDSRGRGNFRGRGGY